MSVEQLVAILGAAAVLIGSVTALLRQMHRLELRVDGRLTQLLELTKTAAIAEGKLIEKEGGTLVPIDEPVHDE
jgi:hypothetical protein